MPDLERPSQIAGATIAKPLRHQLPRGGRRKAVHKAQHNSSQRFVGRFFFYHPAAFLVRARKLTKDRKIARTRMYCCCCTRPAGRPGVEQEEENRGREANFIHPLLRALQHLRVLERHLDIFIHPKRAGTSAAADEFSSGGGSNLRLYVGHTCLTQVLNYQRS